MEFLVRTEDKINIQTWCFNPIHEGEKVVFDDGTFQAPCPQCGETQYLYRKNNAITKKGHFICFEPDGFEWGRLEKKHYGIVKIPNVTHEQAVEWCSSVKNQTIENEIEVLRAEMMAEKDKVKMEELKKSIKQKMNEAQIYVRARKYGFDYEKCIFSEANWEDNDIDSSVIEIKEENKTLIKIYAIS